MLQYMLRYVLKTATSPSPRFESKINCMTLETYVRFLEEFNGCLNSGFDAFKNQINTLEK